MQTLWKLSIAPVTFQPCPTGKPSRKTGFSIFLADFYADARKNHGEPGDGKWHAKRKQLFKSARDKWNLRTFEMRRSRAQYSQRARQLNAEANCKRDALLICKDVEDCENNTRAGEVKQHQLSLLNIAVQHGMIGPPAQSLDDTPSVHRQHALPELANRQEAIPAPLDDVQHQPDTDGMMVVLDEHDIHKDSSLFLHHHGQGLHGLGDSVFGLSEDLVKASMNTQGFIKQTDLQFQVDHSGVCTEINLALEDRDDVTTMKPCQELCGRFCRKSIEDGQSFRNAIEMVRSIARIASSRRDVKNGNTFHLSPSFMLPVLIIVTPNALYGRLACRITFNPLEVDWIHGDISRCSDHNGDTLFRLTLAFECLHNSNNLCPLVDSMTEFSIWMSQVFRNDAGYECKLFTQYELDEHNDHILILRSKHESKTVATIDENSFAEFIGKKPSVHHKDPNQEFEFAAKSVGQFLSLLGGDNTKQSKQQKPTSTATKQLLKSKQKSSKTKRISVNLYLEL